jgi:hypothetical protein
LLLLFDALHEDAVAERGDAGFLRCAHALFMSSDFLVPGFIRRRGLGGAVEPESERGTPPAVW